MDIVDFLDHCTGKWFSQRTTHDLIGDKAESGRADLWVRGLEPNDDSVVALCDRADVDPSTALAGWSIRWEGFTASPDKQLGTSIVVWLKAEGSRAGKFLSTAQAGDRSQPSLGSYALDRDDVLTFETPMTSGLVRERLWFVAPNLRMRTRELWTGDRVMGTAFCSEIRMGVAAPSET